MGDNKIKKYIMSNEEVIDYLENGLKCYITQAENKCDLDCTNCDLKRDKEDVKMAFKIALAKMVGITKVEKRLKESVSMSEKNGLNNIANGEIIALSLMLEEGLIGEKAE